ncbi:MAG: trehalose-phosphatase [Chloroflexota bacterium]|nr:trehalose-phosphatase [Chloroflexota bacterium]
MTLYAPPQVERRIEQARRLRLFLDYDGTLADFAPTPDHVEPQPEVVALLTALADHPDIRVAVISGRRLGHVEELVPVSRLLLAGTYGVELRLPDGERVDRVPYDEIRPVLEQVKPRWERLLAGRDGFFLEDKGWALAIHARDAAHDEAEEVLDQARRVATAAAEGAARRDQFRILGGHKFLEIGPALAHKGRTVDYLLQRHPWPGALPVYVGDDDKDEEAFAVIHAHGGLAVKVCDEPCHTQADARLPSPQAVRRWLATLPARLGD